MVIGPLIGLSLSLAEERFLWLASSAVLYVIATNLTWVMRPLARRVRWSPASGVLLQVVRFTYHVGVPYLALLSGVVTLESMGLVTLTDAETVQLAALATVAALVLAALVAWQYRRQVGALGRAAGLPLAERGEETVQEIGWSGVLFSVVTQQIHWAFYRALAVLILADPYVGSFAGLGLVLLEAYAVPETRRRLRYPAQAELLIVNAIFAVVSAVLFVLTATSWLAAGAHLAAALGWLWFVHDPYGRSAQEA